MRTTLLSLLCLCLAISASGVDRSAETRSPEWLTEHYPFMTQRGVSYTFETQFDWPEGYNRIDSASLNGYQFWVSNLPLWHNRRPAARVTGIMYNYYRISRPVHLPWRTVRFYDYTIPLQLLAEYYTYVGDTSKIVIAPFAGDTLTYERYLKNTPTSYLGKSLKFEPSEPRPSSEDEFNRFVDQCAKWTTYESLAANCDSVDSNSVLPGDMLIAWNDGGRKGQVWVVIGVITNDSGDRLYVVGTGSQKKCDFYIPLFNDNRDYPWIDIDAVQALAYPFPHKGFYRFRVE